MQIRVTASAALPPGAWVPVEIRNASAHAQGYNMCINTQLEESRDGQWTPIDRRGQVCKLSETVLAPRSRSTEQFLLPRTLRPGTYRLVMYFRPERTGAAPLRAESDTFTVA